MLGTMLGTMELTRLTEDLYNDGVSQIEWCNMREGLPQASFVGGASSVQATSGPVTASPIDESSTTRMPFGQGGQGSTGSGETIIVGSKYSSVQTIF
jgi:hypothetical protein